MRKLKMISKTDVKNLVEKEIKKCIGVMKDLNESKRAIRLFIIAKKSILSEIKTLGE